MSSMYHSYLILTTHYSLLFAFHTKQNLWDPFKFEKFINTYLSFIFDNIKKVLNNKCGIFFNSTGYVHNFTYISIR